MSINESINYFIDHYSDGRIYKFYEKQTSQPTFFYIHSEDFPVLMIRVCTFYTEVSLISSIDPKNCVYYQTIGNIKIYKLDSVIISDKLNSMIYSIVTSNYTFSIECFANDYIQLIMKKRNNKIKKILNED